MKNKYNEILKEKNIAQKNYRNEINKNKNLKIKEDIIKKFNENNLEKLQNIYDDNNQMNADANINMTFETFDNSNNIDELIEYNQLLTEKQKFKKTKLN